MTETAVFSDLAAAQMLERGIGPEHIKQWPLVLLPEYVVRGKRIREAEYEGREPTFEPSPPVHGLKTQWGVIVATIEDAPHLGSGQQVWHVDGYLEEDPAIDLLHLRNGVEQVGIWLSDLVEPGLSVGEARRGGRST